MFQDCKLFRQRGIIALLPSDSVVGGGDCPGGQRVESNGIGWIFLSTFVSREEGGKGKGRWLASLSLDLVDSFIRGERRFEEG